MQFFGPIVCIRCLETLNETVIAQHDKSKEKSQIESRRVAVDSEGQHQNNCGASARKREP